MSRRRFRYAAPIKISLQNQTKQTNKRKEFKDSDHRLKSGLMKIRNWMRWNCGQMWRQKIDFIWRFNYLHNAQSHNSKRGLAVTTDKSRLSWTHIIGEICVFSNIPKRKLALNKLRLCYHRSFLRNSAEIKAEASRQSLHIRLNAIPHLRMVKSA